MTPQELSSMKKAKLSSFPINENPSDMDLVVSVNADKTKNQNIRVGTLRGLKGNTGDPGLDGAQGPEGPQGPPGTTDYNELENLPDLTLKADKATTYTKIEVDAALAGKAETIHVHTIAGVTGLQAALDGKSATNHTHTAANITDFDAEVSNNTNVAANTAARHTHTNKTVLDATTASYTTADETKLDGIAAGAQVNTVTSVAGKTGEVSLSKDDVGLSNVDNTSDADKPVSTATQVVLDEKAETSYVDYRDKIESDFLSQAIVKPVTIFDPGHGFTKTSSAGTQTEDSIDGYKKNNSMVLTTAGDGSPVTSRKSIATIDFTGKIPIIAIKVSAIANLSKILVKLSSDGMTSNWYSLNPDPEKFRFLNDNVWIPVNLSFSVATIPRNGAVDYSPLVGSPDRSSINTIEVSVQDNSLGPVSVKFGLIGYTDEPPRPAVSLTFDDGRISQYTLARKKMDEYGMPGTAYINDYSVGDGTHMSIAQLKEMQDQSGWDISAHTSNHTNLVNATASEVERQFRVNKTWLIENGFSKGANHLAYPFGRFDYEKVIPLAKKYFASARTVASYPESSKTSNPYALRGYYVLNTASLQQMKNAVTRAIANNEWALFTFHSIVVTPTGVEEDLPQATFDAFIDWLATQDVDVKPVSQVLEAQAPSTDSSKLNKSGDIMDGNLGF